MTLFAIISILAGATLGLRSDVLILIPAILIQLVVALVANAAFSIGPWLVVLVVPVVALQVGYLGGAATRLIVAAARVARSRSAARSPAVSDPAL